MRCGVRAVLRILFCALLVGALFRDNCIGLLGGALCFEGFKG